MYLRIYEKIGVGLYFIKLTKNGENDEKPKIFDNFRGIPSPENFRFFLLHFFIKHKNKLKVEKF